MKKDGFGVDGTDLTFRDGDRVVFTARLLPERGVAKADQPPVAGAADDEKGFVPLFNGKDLTGWTGINGTDPEWQVRDGYLEVVPGKADVWTKQTFGPDFRLHLEFWLPLMPDAKGQARANSGVFLQGRYEIQILDSFMNETYADGSVGALYRLIAPDKTAQETAIRPPEQWQSYDITFHAPRVDDTGKVTANGRITVVLNNVTIINNGQFDKATLGGTEDKLGAPARSACNSMAPRCASVTSRSRS